MTIKEKELQDMNQEAHGNCWYDEERARDSDDEFPSGEYELTASPSDLNIRTLFDCVGSGAIKIPGF